MLFITILGLWHLLSIFVIFLSWVFNKELKYNPQRVYVSSLNECLLCQVKILDDPMVFAMVFA